jgi:hypothetical protein
MVTKRQFGRSSAWIRLPNQHRGQIDAHDRVGAAVSAEVPCIEAVPAGQVEQRLPPDRPERPKDYRILAVSVVQRHPRPALFEHRRGLVVLLPDAIVALAVCVSPFHFLVLRQAPEGHSNTANRFHHEARCSPHLGVQLQTLRKIVGHRVHRRIGKRLSEKSSRVLGVAAVPKADSVFSLRHIVSSPASGPR